MQGQYEKQQKEINGDSEKAHESMINRLFCQHAIPHKKTETGPPGADIVRDGGNGQGGL